MNEENLVRISEDIDLKHIPKKKERDVFAEVSTPFELRKDMLDVLPKSFWKNKNNKVYEPSSGKGGFLIDIVRYFMKGLKDKIKNKKDRYKHIVEEQLYFADINKKNIELGKKLIDPLNEYKLNTYIGDTLKIDMKKVFGVDSFDLIVGNPPYNVNQTKTDTKPIYNLFIEKYIDKCKYLLFVIPSRWFVGGKGLEDFRKFMLKRDDIEIIEHEDDAKKWFGKTVEIKGGVNYFLKNSDYKGKCKFNGELYDLKKYDRIIKPEYHYIVDKINGKNYKKLIDIYRPSSFYGYISNDKRLKTSGKILCYVSTLKKKDRKMYIDSYNFTKDNGVWKVITPESSHKGFSGFGELFIGKPDEIYTNSYISFKVKNKKEAKSLISYLKTKLANYLLSSRKISQHIHEDTLKWIPLVPLDRIWNNSKVYKYFKLNKKDVGKIEKIHIKSPQ